MKILDYDILNGFRTGSIETYEGDNNTEEYKIRLYKDNFKSEYTITGKTVRLVMVNKYKKGDIIDLTTEGTNTINLPVKSQMTIKDGVYYCQFNITSTNFNQSTKDFTIVVNNSLLEEITGEIVGTENYRILIEALDRVKVVEDRLDVILPQVEDNIPRLELALEQAQGYQEFVKDVKENTKEIAEARGNNNNLKQELDDRFNLVNDNLKAQWLEQGGTSIKVLNSLNGTTRDLTIEGNTLHNLAKTKTNTAQEQYNYISLNYSCEANKVYTCIAYVTKTGNATLKFMLEDNNGQQCCWKDITGDKVVIKLTPNMAFNRACFYYGDDDYAAGSRVDFDNCMFLEGDHTGNPPSTYFEGIKSVGELEGNKISILSYGKNLINDKNPIFGSKDVIYFENCKLTKGAMLKLSTYGKKLGGGRIIAINSKNEEFILKDWETTLDKVTCPTDEYKIKFWCSDCNPDFKAATDKRVQLEEGTTATPYEPYKADKKDISLPFEFGFKGLPNGARDTKIGSKIIQKIKRRVLNGNESWRSASIPECDILQFLCTVGDIKGFRIIADRFKNIHSNNTEECTWIFREDSVVINIAKSKLETQDVAGFKKWLQANNVVVYYELATPVEYQLPEDYQLATNKDVTYIQSLNSIESTQKCKVAVDRDATTTRLIEENKELEGENKKLTENQNTLTDTLLYILEPTVIPEQENSEIKNIIENLKKIKGENYVRDITEY